VKILRLPAVIETCGLSRSTIYEMLNPKSRRYKPDFPKPIKLSSSSVGWFQHELNAWLLSKKHKHKCLSFQSRRNSNLPILRMGLDLKSPDTPLLSLIFNIVVYKIIDIPNIFNMLFKFIQYIRSINHISILHIL
jgi:prophage regulatory protein